MYFRSCCREIREKCPCGPAHSTWRQITNKQYDNSISLSFHSSLSLSLYTFISFFLSLFAFSSKKLDSTIFPWVRLTDLPTGIVGHVAQGGSWGQPIITDSFDQRFKHSLSLSHVLSLSLPISHCLCLDLCPHSREGQESERWMQSSREEIRKDREYGRCRQRQFTRCKVCILCSLWKFSICIPQCYELNLPIYNYFYLINKNSISILKLRH